MASVKSRTGLRLAFTDGTTVEAAYVGNAAVLRRIESDEQLEDEQTGGC